MEMFEKDDFKGQWIMLRDENGDGELTVSGESSIAFKLSATAAVLAETLRNEAGFDLAEAMALVTSSIAGAYGADLKDGDDA